MKSLCIKVAKNKGEQTRKKLHSLKVLDTKLKIHSDAQYLYLPIQRQLELHSDATLNQLDNITLTTHDFIELKKQKTLIDLLGFAPNYEIIGDIAVMPVDLENAERQFLAKIAETILKVHKNIKVVLQKKNPVSGEFRIREFKVLAGENRTYTIHKEHGCRYALDLAKVYFNPRLSTERMRIAQQINNKDTVVDMFAGVGPFSILIAKKKNAKVIAIDKNPIAIKYLKENINLNHINMTKIKVLEGDAKEIAHKYKGVANHVIMNLPHKANVFLKEAMLLLAPHGVIHYYDMRPDTDLFEGAIKIIQKVACKVHCTINILNKRIVRTYAPHVYNICIEFNRY
ncbi:MAG TPA: class I SAM-dependent methyltransferase family protein [Methanosarcinales archaeon]|nr:class I SAM-dependent methyltransferase family protein [Methanosarcinales archaeon]